MMVCQGSNLLRSIFHKLESDKLSLRMAGLRGQSETIGDRHLRQHRSIILILLCALTELQEYLVTNDITISNLSAIIER